MTAQKVPDVLVEILQDPGNYVHIFRSGGGLRVARIESASGELLGYGESVEAYEALRICAEDFVAGTRPYSAVYGILETHYYTGNSEAANPLDGIVLGGWAPDLFKRGQSYVACIKEVRGVQEALTGQGSTLDDAIGDLYVKGKAEGRWS